MTRHENLPGPHLPAFGKLKKTTTTVLPPTTQDHQHSTTPIRYLKEWSEVTPWHGINSASRAKTVFTRVAWTIVVLVASFLAFYQSGFLIQSYINESTWITSVTYEIPEDGGLEWPNMTVCNLDSLFTPILERANITDPYQIAFASNLRMQEGLLFYKQFQEVPLSNLSDFEAIRQTVMSIDNAMVAFSNMSLSDILMRFSTPCKRIVLHCGLTDTFSLHKQAHNCCCEDKGEGQRAGCFLIQPTRVFGKSHNRVGGENGGVYFLLNPNVQHYYSKLTLDLAPSAGLRLFLHFNTLDASVPEMILVSPGTHTMVTLVYEKQRTIAQQSQMIPFYNKKGGCVDKHEYHYVESEGYSQALCFIDCWVTWSINEFGCTIETVPLKEKRECVGEQIHVVMQNDTGVRWNATYSDGFNYYTCISSCGEQCEANNVDAKTSQAIFPAPPKVAAFVTYLNRAFGSSGTKYTEEDAKQLIYLEMFYKSLEYKVITKMEKTTIGQFISNIGGALSVWTGLSLLGLLQAVIYWSEFALAWLRHARRVSGDITPRVHVPM